MKILNSLKKSSDGIAKTSKRFPLTVICLAAVFVLMTLLIFTDFDSEDLGFLMIAFACGAFFSFFAKLCAEKLGAKYNRENLFAFLALASSVFVTALMFILHYWIQEDFHFLYVFGVISVSVLFSFVLLIKDKEKLEIFPNLIRSFLLAFALGFILFAGTSLCVLAFDSLIVEIDEVERVYLMLANITWFVSALLFLSYVFDEKRDDMPSKAYKYVFLYTELPIYLLLIFILYIYLIKIIAGLNIPSGSVNMFASFASAFYIFNYAALKCYEKENLLASFFIKAGGIIMMPVILMQCVSLGIRVYYYGLTPARVLSICFIAATVVFAVSSVVKKFGFKPALAVSACIVGIVLLTPLNVINISAKSQEHILEKTLVSNGMLDENGAIVPKKDDSEISNEDKEKLTGAYDYLRYTPAKLKDNFEVVKHEYFEDLFGFERFYGYGYDKEPPAKDIEYRWFYNNFAQEKLDISEYKSMVYVYYSHYRDDDVYYGDEKSTAAPYYEPEEEYYGIDFTLVADKLIENGEERCDNLVIPVDDEKDFIFVDADIAIDHTANNYKSIYISGYVLFK